jgi:uncharacterized protein
MDYEWDEAKRLANLRKHGIDFADVEEFDWDNATKWIDERKAYGEERFLALGFFRGRVHSVAFTERRGITRIISFRKAEKREVRRYEKDKDQSR